MSRARKPASPIPCGRCGRTPCGCPPPPALAARLAGREAARRDLHARMAASLSGPAVSR